MRKGQKTTIQCVAKSFPQSDIHWVTGIGKNAYRSESSISQQKGEFTMLSTFILDSPTSAFDGAKVDCIVKPKYGRSIRRRFILSYKYGKQIHSHPSYFKIRSNEGPHSQQSYINLFGTLSTVQIINSSVLFLLSASYRFSQLLSFL